MCATCSLPQALPAAIVIPTLTCLRFLTNIVAAVVAAAAVAAAVVAAVVAVVSAVLRTIFVVTHVSCTATRDILLPLILTQIHAPVIGTTRATSQKHWK